MAIISLRKLWSAAPGQESEELLRVIRLLLQGIALHSVEGDREDHDKFRQDMQKLLGAVDAEPTAATLLVTTGAALKTLEEYSQRVTRFSRTQGAELQHMISMLTRTVEALGSGSAQSVARLREIEGRIEKASVLEDVRLLKHRMEECLQGIREESKRQKTESTQTVEVLKREIQQSQERIRSVSGPRLDPVTGLPARAEGEIALAEAAERAKPSYAVLFIVDRVTLINTRFGYAVGDRIMRIYVDELRPRCSAADRLYRWSGPTLLALIERMDPLEKVRDQLRSLVPPRTEKTLQLSNRTALLPVSATWSVFAVAKPIENVIQQLDSFVSSQAHSET